MVGAPAPPAPGSNTGRRARALVVGVVLFVAGFFVPRVVDDPFQVGVAIDGVLLGMVALAVGFLIHKCALVSLGHAAFFGGAAYVVAIGTTEWEWHPGVAVAIAIASATTFALLTGALIVRVPGISFAVLTLAIGQALYVLSVQSSVRPLTGGFDGRSVSYDGTIFGYGPREFGDPERFWPIAWIALSAACLALWLLSRSRWGLTLEAIRENEERARFCGISTYIPRLLAFALSGAIAAVAGALFALNTAFVAPDSLHWTTSANALVAAIVGGVGSIVGPPIGALLYVFARERFATSGDLQFYTGIALVVVLVLAPAGISGTIGKGARRLWATVGRSGR
ncbi:MAG: branched-chain amino acid ABC transporter permease [Ilumatobacteraceae bacterium]